MTSVMVFSHFAMLISFTRSFILPNLEELKLELPSDVCSSASACLDVQSTVPCTFGLLKEVKPRETAPIPNFVNFVIAGQC